MSEPIKVEATRRALKTSPCRGCGKPIAWATSIGGTKKIPLDPKPPVYDVTVQGDDQYVATISDISYVSHFATCPKANWFSSSAKRS
jgi:hypothetical protein